LAFDGNGYSELVIGVPEDDVDGVVNAGSVNVLYGSGGGLVVEDDQLWHLDRFGMEGDPHAWDAFGFSITIGDFNGDRYADVAIGIPNKRLTWDSEAIGAVQVMYGAPFGLGFAGNQLWSQESPYVLDPGEEGNEFGRAVAAGDFDGDGFDDLAIGVPFEEFGSKTDAGAVNILYGTAFGISSDRNIILHQDLPGTADVAEANEFFGTSLAVADFDADGFDDLAVGVSGQDLDTVVNAGAVHVFYGSAAGIDPADDWFFHQSTTGMADVGEIAEFFGGALAAGDFDGNGFYDLAVGVSQESFGAAFDAGAVHVVLGTMNGLAVPGNSLWHQNVPGMDNAAEQSDHFGSSLAAGDFDHDGFDDLAVGIRFEDNGTVVDSGAVHVIYGANGGLNVAGNWFFHQNTPGMIDQTETNDQFGHALTVGDFDGDGYEDLAIGVHLEDIGADIDCGAVNVVLGSASGLAVDGNQFWHRDSPGLEGSRESDDTFGYALAALPRTDIVFIDGFETGDFTGWSASIP
jgi:hypothetical protein